MTVLLTGSGLVGCQVMNWLHEWGEKVVVYDVAPRPDLISQLAPIKEIEIVRGDLLDFPTFLRAVRDRAVKRIIHTAGMLAAPTAQNPYWGTLVNIQGTMNILEASRILDVERIVFASSGIVYSSEDESNEPVSEDHPMRPLNVYGTCKLAGEHLGRNYDELYGIKFLSTRFGVVFGPWGGAPTGAAEMIIQPFLSKLARGEEAELKPDFMNKQLPPRLVYSKDAGWSLARLCTMPDVKHKAFNISMDSVPTWIEIVEMVREIVPRAKIVFDEDRLRAIPPSPERRPLSMSLAKEEIGFRPTTMREALEDFVQWLRKIQRVV